MVDVAVTQRASAFFLRLFGGLSLFILFEYYVTFLDLVSEAFEELILFYMSFLLNMDLGDILAEFIPALFIVSL